MRGLAAATFTGKSQLAHAAMKATGAVRRTQFHRPPVPTTGKKAPYYLGKSRSRCTGPYSETNETAEQACFGVKSCDPKLFDTSQDRFVRKGFGEHIVHACSQTARFVVIKQAGG